MGVYQKGGLEISKGIGFTFCLIFFRYATSIFPIQPLSKQKLVILSVSFQMSSFCLFSIIVLLGRHFHTWLFLFYFCNINSMFTICTLHIYNNLIDFFFHKIFMIWIFVFKINIELRSFLMRCLKLKSTSPLACQMIVLVRKLKYHNLSHFRNF